jgi:hypothetical protein
LDLWIKSYGEMNILGEVWARWASIGINQQELTTCAQKCRQEEEGNFARGEFRTPTKGRLATSGRLLAIGRSLTNWGLLPLLSPPFSYFFSFIFYFLVLWGNLGMGLAFWENGCTALPFFEPYPYTWKGEIFHISWSLEISFSFYFNFS